jgi:tetratricopeptide (TPR) repeat protein
MMDNVWSELAVLLAVIGGAGAFGGLISALLKTHAPIPHDPDARKAYEFEYTRRYILPCPLNPRRPKMLGFWGDMLVGVAAGLSLFVGLEGLLGVGLSERNTAEDYLRLVALGIISGYMGTSILDAIALALSTRIMQRRQKFDEEAEKVRELEARIAATDQVSHLIHVGDAFRRWGDHQEAKRYYDQALNIDPNNVHILIHKSFVLAEQAEKLGLDNGRRADLYEQAIELMNDGIRTGAPEAPKLRVYYTRACYRAQLPQAQEEKRINEIVNDLGIAIRGNSLYAAMAARDKDFDPIRKTKEFRSLMEAA